MAISLFDLFTIGIGPSSSHTVGPMRAAARFAAALEREGHLNSATRIRVELFGSLGFTGRGHGSDRAVLLGLEGEAPESVDTESVADRVATIRDQKRLRLLGKHPISYSEENDLIFNRQKALPFHPNGMQFLAFDEERRILLDRAYYSVGGGFVVDPIAAERDELVSDHTCVPLPYKTGAELLDICQRENLEIHEVVLQNELHWRSEDDIRRGILEIWKVMEECIGHGCRTGGTLPGGLKVRRRAPDFHAKLLEAEKAGGKDPLTVLDWVNLFALAVNEENAAGGRVVTAPTNGAAGIIPAVLSYYIKFLGGDHHGIVRFFLTATAIGILYKEQASISGAEVGCQGEVGVACSMAAAGLASALNGTPSQIENAAEIAMEHNLGLTCDPVGGLVQIPCIERNAIASVKAINSSRMARLGDGTQKVSLDKVIRTMRETGADMKTKYKETSRGGLAINVIEC